MLQDPNYVYTVTKIIGHLVALEEHLSHNPCPSCILKHKSVLEVYLHELQNYAVSEQDKRQYATWFEVFKKEKMSVRSLRLEVMRYHLQKINEEVA